LKKGDALTPLLFKFPLDYAIRKVKIKTIHQILDYVVIVASKDTGLEVNAETIEYIVMPRDQKAGQRHNIQTDNSSFKRVEHFKYFVTT
jgi:hypothetical protein